MNSSEALVPTLSTFVLGLVLGLRHATDTDHLVVISTLVQREPTIGRAARIAALWGAGHTATFLGLGVLIVVAGIQLPVEFERATDVIVGVMLLGLGLWHLWSSGWGKSAATLALPTASPIRPLLIGLVHGLAGSAGIALIAGTTLRSRGLALAYLGLVALGTLIGMVVLTVLLARPIGWTMRQNGLLRQTVTGFASLLSVGFGLFVLVHALLVT